MAVRVAINGFGRIGKNVLRALVEAGRSDVQVVAVNDLGSAEVSAHLFRYDSVHGPFHGMVTVAGDQMTVNNGAMSTGAITMLSIADPTKLPWGAMGIDVVMECTGRFTDAPEAKVHLDAGAKRVLVSAPSKGADITVVYGVNHEQIRAEHTIISNASCTTNCLAPVAKVLNDLCGINQGFMTTVHAYTNDQRILDQPHKDLRRARAAGMSMIPTTTGAAKAVGLVLPELKGKLDGTAIRVPTANVSMIDLTFIPTREVTVEEINTALTRAAEQELKGVLGVTNEPLVSIDFNHNPASSTADLAETQVIEGRLARVLSWYDNEWGFSNRMIDVAAAMGKV